MTWPTKPPPTCVDVAAVVQAAPVSGYYPLQHPRSEDGYWTVAELLVFDGGDGRIWSFPGVEEHGYDSELVGGRIGPRIGLPEPGGPRPASGPVVFEID